MIQRDQAYDAFTRYLLERKLMPGQFVSQRELAEMTALPLGAIREMIPRLEAEGLLKAFAQRGLQIVHIDLRMVREAFQLREIIETAAIQAFVRNGSAAALEAQRRAHEVLLRAVEQSSPELLSEAQAVDWSFHDFLVDAMDNDLVKNVHRVNSIRIRMILQDRIGLSPDRIPYVFDQHHRIINALEARDAAAATQAMLAHLASSRQRALNWAGGVSVVDDPE
ncbi:MAG: GntR family transcriptional regulator [Ancalomicrobiaceae bacterium]|nr:GntR family transcriptional regulator [Ancalomicrobiaceae bacterium]